MNEKLDSLQPWMPGIMLLDDIEYVCMSMDRIVRFSTRPVWGNQYPSEMAKESAIEADNAIFKAMEY